MTRLERLTKKHAALLAKADELSTPDDERNELLCRAALVELQLGTTGPPPETGRVATRRQRKDGPCFRFQSFGLPEELTSWPNWVGWVDGVALPIALGRSSVCGLALPTAIWTWAEFHEALRTYRERGVDGLAFVPEEPFLFVTLRGAVEGRRKRPSASARAVIRQARTYAEIAPGDRDVTLVLETGTELFDRLRDRGLPVQRFPETCGLHMYDGEVWSRWPLFHVPLSGLAVGPYPRVRWLHPELFEEVN